MSVHQCASSSLGVVRGILQEDDVLDMFIDAIETIQGLSVMALMFDGLILKMPKAAGEDLRRVLDDFCKKERLHIVGQNF